MKLSELSKEQRSHLAWRLDHNTACGYLTACRVANFDQGIEEDWIGDLDLVQIFMQFGNRTHRSAVILAKKVIAFKPKKGSYESNQKVGRMIRAFGGITASELPSPAEIDEFILFCQRFTKTLRSSWKATGLLRKKKKHANT